MARKLIKLGEISGCGGETLTLLTTMFIVQNSLNEITGYPNNIRFKSGGSFVNCTRVNDTTLNLNNPSSDSTFTFEVEYQAADDGWDWHSFVFTGVLYNSLPETNITTTLIRNKIGASTNKVGLLCTSSLVNKYSYNLPNGVAPYKLGDFHRYTHGSIYPSRVGYYSRIGNSEDDRVPWETSHDLVVTGAKVFRGDDDLPLSAVRVLIIGEVYGDSKNMEGTDIGIYAIKNIYNSEWTFRDTVYTAKIQHHDGSTWNTSEEIQFTIYYAGKPYEVNWSNVTREADTATISIVAVDCATHNVTVKFSVLASEGWITHSKSPTSNFDSYTASVTSGNVIPSGAAWKLESQYGHLGTWYEEASGTLP